MPLNPAPLPIQFEGGVDTRTDHKQVPATRLLDLQNCVFTKQTTLSKRNGYRALSTQVQNAGGDVVNARGLATRDDELLAFTDQRAYSYRPSADRWADTGEVAATTARTMPLARTGTYQTQPDIATRNGVSVVAWEDSRGGVWCSVLEASTERILLAQQQLDASANARNVRCIPVGEVLHVLWTRVDLQQILVAVINPALPSALPTPSILTGDLSAANPAFDAESAALAFPAIRPGVIAWVVATGTRFGYIAPTGVLGSPATGLPSVAEFTSVQPVTSVAVSFAASNSSIAVATIRNGTSLSILFSLTDLVTSVAFFSPALSGGSYARLTLSWGGARPSGARGCWWAAEGTSTRTDLCFIDSGLVAFFGVNEVGPTTTLRGHNLVSRAFCDSSDAYAMVAHTVRLFPYVATLRLSGPAVSSPGAIIVSRLLPGEAAGALMRTTGAGTRAWTTHLPSVTQEDVAETAQYARTHAVMVPYRIQLSSANGDQFSEQGLKRCALGFGASYQAAQLGRGLYLASAAPMHYDGEAWHEADFHTAPDYGFDTSGAPVALSGAFLPIAGAGVAAGTYLYKLWYEAVDAQGELHRGPTSTGVLVTIATPASIRIQIPTCRLTRFSNVRICVARTKQGATGTDTTLELFRVTSTDVTVKTGNNRYVDNDPTVDFVTFVDDLSDAAIGVLEPLYTNGGVLSNNPAPWGGDMIAVGKGRLFWNDTSNPLLVRFSQRAADDVALQAPVDLAVDVDPLGGGITAIGVLDDAVLPFKAGRIYVFGGPGPRDNPNEAPEANAFTPAELVSSDVGCTSIASLCPTPVGITFQSLKGIMMLTRDRQIADIGGLVEAYNAQTITRSTLMPKAQRIVYLTNSGRSLLWDYQRNQWSTFTNHEGLDAVVINDLYYYLRTDSRVFVETPGAYVDDNSRIPMLIETAWIHFAQYLQGWQRILYAYFIGEWQSRHQFSMRYRIDYNAGYSAAYIADVNNNYIPSMYGTGLYGESAYGGTTGGGTRYQRRFHINKRCQSISFRLEDIELEGDAGASFELSELLLIGAGLGPDFKVGAARTGMGG